MQHVNDNKQMMLVLKITYVSVAVHMWRSFRLCVFSSICVQGEYMSTCMYAQGECLMCANGECLLAHRESVYRYVCTQGNIQ